VKTLVNKPTVDILLATFNGAKYLPELLQSLEDQTFTDWQLIIRDDGSTDDTRAIIESWTTILGDKVKVLLKDDEDHGACSNFAVLMAASKAPYFMLCDQDDVWLPNKIHELHKAARQAEELVGIDTPVLVHSDLIVVDNDLREIHSSFWRYQRLLSESTRNRGELLILQNYVTGCSTLGNSALRQAALPIPKQAVMHDWWLALVAANLGKLIDHPAPTVRYRQHGGNVLGAKPWSLKGVVERFLQNPQAAVQRTRSMIQKTQQQAEVFVRTYSARLNPRMAGIFTEYSELGSNSLWKRKTFLFRRKLWPGSLIRAASIWWVI
jgi:glycosyltransferase involved in cell wall biosynthesis